MTNLRCIGIIIFMLVFTGCKTNDPAPAEKDSVLKTKEYIRGEYTLIFKNTDEDLPVDERENMVNIFFTVYPELVKRFNPNAAKTVTFIIDIQYSGVAVTVNNSVTFSALYRQDTDVITHEAMHVVQAYKGDAPSWLVEGIADYARYKYGVDNTGWSLAPIGDGQSYKDGYTVTAAFLVWLEDNVSSDIVDKLNAALSDQTYSDNTWVELTGSTVDKLWASYYY